MISKKILLAAFARRTSVLPVCSAVACAVCAPSAQALTDFTPYATVSIEHNSNVFERPNDAPPFAASGNTELGDTIKRYLVGANADFAWERERLRLNAQGERLDYDRFSLLNHDEHKLGATFDWHLGAIVDGSFEYVQTRMMSPLGDILSDQLELQTEKTGTATVRILFTPRWRFDLAPRWHQLDTPLPAFSNFGLHDTGGAASLNYLGIEKLTAGLRVEYDDGAYHGILAATRYHQTTAQLTANYAVTGLSSFDGQVGYTQRDSSLVDPKDSANTAGPGGVNVGGAGGVVGKTTTLTGGLGFHRQLSVKTSVNARVFREVDSYIAGANSEIGTGGEVSVKWDPDVKFSVLLRYRQETQSIQGALVIGGGFANRTDHTHDGELDVDYHMLRWLTLRPYVIRDLRSSNFREANYNSTLIGVHLTARLQ